MLITAHHNIVLASTSQVRQEILQSVHLPFLAIAPQLDEDKLKKQLLEKQISFYGNFNYLGYNPPFQVINRRNEILVNINWSE